MDINEDWVTGIRYLIMDPYFIDVPEDEKEIHPSPLIESSCEV